MSGDAARLHKFFRKNGKQIKAREKERRNQYTG
jgi:hypothetical protein